MTIFTRALMLADSNGRPVQLPGDTTSNPNNPVFEPFYKTPVYGRMKNVTVSAESTGWVFVEFWLGSNKVSDPVLLSPGISINIDADMIVPVGVRRAGEVWCVLSDTENPQVFTRADHRAVSRGMQCNVLPLTQIPLVPGGGLSNIWCHPNSAPGSANPMVMGVAAFPMASALILSGGFTAAHWNSIGLCAFSVDPDSQNVVNVKRITSSIANIPNVIAVDINPWERIGVLAIPSASYPGGAPATILQFEFESYNTYSRNAEFGFVGFGSKSELV